MWTIWLEPFASAEQWAVALTQCAQRFSGIYLWSLADRQKLEPSEVAEEIEEVGVLRVSGFDRDINVFRRPNELGVESFESVWERTVRALEGGIRLPAPLDLYVSKANTGRDQDWTDQLFLESLVKARFKERLPVCDLREATEMLDRFLDPETLQFAKTNPHPEVRELALKYLHEFHAEGDPYSRDILPLVVGTEGVRRREAVAWVPRVRMRRSDLLKKLYNIARPNLAFLMG
tara:strand:- start:18 stop:716 length:699 start_codon:yes stop_codon:yes gene_type:complete